VFTLRFDMRAPDFGAPIGELYAAALEMCAWAEDRGALVAVLSEHHGTEDRHLPCPIVLAAAIAARTSRLPILLAALVLPFYDPVRLAEEIGVLDIISHGRVSYVLGVGHRPEEYAHFGLTATRRGALADENLDILRRLLAGEDVGDRDRSIRVTPLPTSGGPQLFIGGGSTAAARRAGRFGLGIIAQAAAPGLQEAYEEACSAAGHEPSFVQLPDPSAPTAVFVADDVDHAWDELGPHLLHDAMTAASYRHGDATVASISRARSVEELREDTAYRILTVDEAAARAREGNMLPLLPLCGGLSPNVAWPYLERAVTAVAQARA
jgi:alkanesulfonate monooxygenase SsuD/methylene tetrahydromethanopterin reductase-like flavin-dependent oxidoreductase (luciferase family)